MLKVFLLLTLMIVLIIDAPSQSTSFTYQGNLRDGANAANGTYDFEFLLFDAISGGNQVGSTLPRNSLSATNGSFSVSLDFGNQFPGANRYLEIHVRPTGSGGFTVLTPRQQISNSPYSVRSLSAVNADTATTATSATTANNSQQLGGVAAGQYVVTTDTRLSDARTPLAGSANYIQNGTAQQTLSNFNISGSGNIGGRLRVEGIPNGNLASFGGNGDFQIDANGIVGGRFTVLQGGNVGIGKNAPTAKLDVNGSMALNGSLSLSGDLGQSGQVLTSSGAGSSAQWISPTNLLYQQTYMALDTAFVTPSTTPTLVPGLSQLVSVSGNAYIIVQFGVSAFAGSCVACGASSAQVEVYIDGARARRVFQDIPNNTANFISGSTLLSVGAGSHTIEIRGESTGPLVNFGCGVACANRSSMIVQVIPQ
jgi:hypothetical protein